MGCRIPDLSLWPYQRGIGQKGHAVSYVLRVIEHLEDDMTYKRVTEADRRLIQRLVGSAGYSMA